jgi:hypothetical protein
MPRHPLVAPNVSETARRELGVPTIHDAVMREVQRIASFPVLGAHAIAERAERAGRPLTAVERDAVEEELTRLEAELATGTLQGDTRTILARPGATKICLEEGDLRRAVELQERLIERFPKVLEAMIPKHAEAIYQTLLGKWRQGREGERRERLGFERRIELVWGEALNGLWLLVTIAREMGQETAAGVGTEAGRTMRLLFRLHARACQIAEEVITLLRAGFADGAHARWRTLHEVAVAMFFIGDRGDDVAERYEAHAAVETWKGARQYQEYHERLGVEPFSSEQMAAMEAAYNQCLAKFGNSFRGDYGWAAEALDNERPTFADIEAAVELEHQRAVYRMASHNVHANAKGVLFRLGLMCEDVLLAGPSNAGLADAGSDTATSLTQATIALTRSREVLDVVLETQVLLRLSKDVNEAFLKADNDLAEREERLQRMKREGDVES